MSTLLFTGATGFLGRNILPSLNRIYDVSTCGISEEDTIKADLASEVPHLTKPFDVVLHACGKAHSVPRTDAEKKAAMEKSPLKDKQFQQQLKQGISQCEAVEKQTSELAKAADKNLSQWKSAGEMLGQSADDYKSALALAGEFANASKNLESVKTAQKNVAEEFSKAEKLRTLLSSEETKQKLAAIAKLKEDLKKLVRDDNNQQNQNQQQNQQNQNQQNQDKNQQEQNKDQQNQNKDKQDQQKDQQQGQDKQDQNQQQQQGGEPQEGKISKEDAERLLEALENDEKETQEKVQKQKAEVQQAKKMKIEKNW